jgi:hypothetical protein
VSMTMSNDSRCFHAVVSRVCISAELLRMCMCVYKLIIEERVSLMVKLIR